VTEVDIVGTAPPAYAGQASQSEAAHSGNAPYDKNDRYINTSTPLIPAGGGQAKADNKEES
jgi:hypothetical protein